MSELFDWASLSSDTRISLAWHTNEIKAMFTRRRVPINNLVQELVAAYQLLGEQQFQAWLKAEIVPAAEHRITELITVQRGEDIH